MTSDHRYLRAANLVAIFGAIIEYVREGGGFRMRSRRTEDGDLVMTMNVAEPEALFPRISRRLTHILQRRRTQ